MINPFDYFQQFICQKVLPLVYDESLSYYEVLAKLTNYVNEMIESVNNLIEAHNSLTKEYADVLVQLQQLQQTIDDMKNGDFIKNGSITLNKLSPDLMNELRMFCTDLITNLVKFVWFGLNDDGYFIAIIPQSWNGILFDTDQEGHLILKY